MKLKTGQLCKTREGFTAIITDIKPDSVRPVRAYIIPSGTPIEEWYYTLAGYYYKQPSSGVPEESPRDIVSLHPDSPSNIAPD